MSNEITDDPSKSLLTEQHLRHLARHVKDLMPEQVDDTALKTLQSIFNQVLFTCAAPGLNTTYRVAAFNALCALIDQSLAKSRPALAAQIFDLDFWAQSFILYLTRSDLAKPKSSRQLLVSLTTALVYAPLDLQTKDQIKKSAAKKLVQGLLQSEDDHLTRSAVSCLAQFLTKNVLSLDIVLEVFEPEPNDQNDELQRFLVQLLNLTHTGDFVSSICQLVTVVLDVHPSLVKPHAGTRAPGFLWVEPLAISFASISIDVPVLRVHILPVLFKRSFTGFEAFLSRLGFYSNEATKAAQGTEELLFASLLAGKDIGFVLETDRPEVWSDGNAVHIPVRAITSYLSRASRTARLTGLALLVQSPTATKPLLGDALLALRTHLHHFMSDTDSNFRSEVSSLMQHLVDRVKSATVVLARHASRFASQGTSTDSQNKIDELQAHRDFLQWLLRDVEWNLRPTATYQRHISALRILTTVIRSGLDHNIDSNSLSKTAKREPRWAFHISVMTPNRCLLLLNLLTNPFDDVRQASANALLLTKGRYNSEDVRKALARAEVSMLATGRADHADGVAHLYRLLHERNTIDPDTAIMTGFSDENMLYKLIQMLETMLEVGRSNLQQAVEHYPMHGLLVSIRYLILQDASIVEDQGIRERLSKCLHTVWIVVKPTLCDDAPEGYVPETTEDEQMLSTKDTLSYCWRALKEASSLLGTLITCADRSIGTVRTSELRSLSLLCFTQLSELRHRGAFSTVAQTWGSCCLSSQTLTPEVGSLLLAEWYERVVQILRNRTLINTRRSAGIPSLLCGILVADKTGEILEQAFVDLECFAREAVDPSLTQEGSLPQVHAMNCLKDIFKNTKLGQQSERQISSSLRLTIHALQSEVWAVRNCGLMLFRAVIDRLLGTSEAHLEDDLQFSKRVITDQSSDIIGTILGLLTAPSTESGIIDLSRNEGVFPALQLLQRLHIPDECLGLAQANSLALTSSRVWHVRDKAARTYASLMGKDSILVQQMLKLGTSPHNELHGALLCLRYMIKRSRNRIEIPSVVLSRDRREESSGIRELLRVVDAEKRFSREDMCPMITAAWIDIIIEAIKLARRCKLSLDDDFTPTEPALHLKLYEAILMIIPPTNDPTKIWRLDLSRALAMLFTHQASVEDNLDRSLMLRMVSRLTDDASVEFLKTLDVERMVPLRSETEGLLHACWTLFTREESAPYLKCRIIKTLLKLITIMTYTERHVLAGLVDLSLIMNPSHALDTPLVADLLLQLRAAVLEISASAEIVDFTGVRNWINDCSVAVGQTGICSREAAALALVDLDHLWSTLNGVEEHGPFLRQLIFVAVDLLNDDDEDVRLLASRTAQQIVLHVLHVQTEMLVPAVASIKLVKLLVSKWPAACDVINSAFTRAFSLTSSTFSSVAERLADLSDESTALFAEEKQNLYIDEASEVRIWADAIMYLAPDDIPKVLVRNLSDWVNNGLDTLKEQAQSQPDGPLSWTSKAEIFTLGLQLIYGTEVLLHLTNRGVKLHIRPSILRCQLAEAIELCRKRADCGLWVREMDRVITDPIFQNFLRVRQVLSRLELTI
nr:uncharacterized protein CFP56_07963 [Quercus suber]